MAKTCSHALPSRTWISIHTAGLSSIIVQNNRTHPVELFVGSNVGDMPSCPINLAGGQITTLRGLAIGEQVWARCVDSAGGAVTVMPEAAFSGMTPQRVIAPASTGAVLAVTSLPTLLSAARVDLSAGAGVVLYSGTDAASPLWHVGLGDAFTPATPLLFPNGLGVRAVSGGADLPCSIHLISFGRLLPSRPKAARRCPRRSFPATPVPPRCGGVIFCLCYSEWRAKSLKDRGVNGR